MTTDIVRLSVSEIARFVSDRKISCVEVVDAFLERIDNLDSRFRCFLFVDPDTVRVKARMAQARVDQGADCALAGVPIAVKDNISTRGMPTTCASKILEGYVPPYDATVVTNLESAGAIVLGKTNLDEFAMGSSTETSAFQITRNPWDIDRSPGGSSGGSAASVAASLAPAALGSDTGGSIRQPASLCGVVGFKPTYGRVSRYGLVAFGSSLDQIGPFARSVEDAALVARAMSGHDPSDSTSLNADPIDLSKLKQRDLKNVKVALPKEMFGGRLQPAVQTAITSAIEVLEKAGATVDEVSIPTIRLGVTTYYIIAPSEASSNLARFDGIRYGPRSNAGGHVGMVEKTRGDGFGHEVKTRIMIGTYALSAGYYDAFYLKAQHVRELMRREFEEVFQRFDVVIGPTSPTTAFRIGELKQDPLALKLLDYCTIPANMGGFPSLSLNCGFADDGLPVGMQIIAAPMGDEDLLQISFAVERALPNATRRPPIP